MITSIKLAPHNSSLGIVTTFSGATLDLKAIILMCIFPFTFALEYITDSKPLSEASKNP